MIDYINSTAHRARHDHRGPHRVPAPGQEKPSSTSARSRSTPSRSPTALRSALRQDPDVILVGEMRDYETIETAINACGDRPPRSVDAAHGRRHRDDQSHHLRLPAPPAEADPSPALRSAEGRSSRCAWYPERTARAVYRQSRCYVPLRSSAIASRTRKRPRLIHGAIAAGHLAVRDADLRSIL